MRQLDMGRLRPFWIVNSVAGEGTAAAIRQLAARPDIARIELDVKWKGFTTEGTGGAEFVEMVGRVTAVTTTTTLTNPAWGVSRIWADKVWQGLGIDGSGVTVAIMDTGVDYLHPDLLPNYRGNLGGGLFDHNGNWYDAVVPTNTIPHDDYGHGTHVAGTAVGQNGIGVAPGANWIAVNIAGPFGFIFTSDARAGFQWLMAPGGSPALAPDVVNASWSGPPDNTIFLGDVKALQTAGIIPVFAAGNGGPFAESIGSPASFTGTLAIAASDDLDEVAWFSSRGPSLLTGQQKPTLAAPGTAVLSAQPANQYGLNSGASMAAPHATGAIALLLAANPALTPAQVTAVLTSTAIPLSSTIPNNDSGWGRLDAYSAVSSQISTGLLEVTLSGQYGVPLGTGITLTTPLLGKMGVEADGNGRLAIPLPPGTYTVSAAPFGYAPTVFSAAVITNSTSLHTVLLSPLPGGVVNGQVLDEAGHPVTTAVHILNTPLTAATDNQGNFAVNLPTGVYTLRVAQTGYWLADEAVNVGPGTAVTATFTLTAAPSVLLVDSGAWYYQSQASYFANALTQNRLAHNDLTINNPFTILTYDDLGPYDVVVWSAPLDSPGYLGVTSVISDYLDGGGNLFISGQDVGVWDGSGFTELWWYKHLAGQFLGETAVTQTITGLSNIFFAGRAFTLNGGSSADNQSWPDVSRPRPGSLTQPIFEFEDGRAAGLQAGLCQPFRIAYLGFGLEGITDAADRARRLTAAEARLRAARAALRALDVGRNQRAALVFLAQTASAPLA
ncbi:MAG: S8 family serine peptidase, partial [Anaerolineae bacterium]